MLVLSRRINESIIIEGGIRVTVVGIQGNRVRVAFEAPQDVAIHRAEIHEVRQQFVELTMAELEC